MKFSLDTFSMKSSMRLIVIAISAYAFFLLVSFPATYAYSLLKSTETLDNDWILSNISGSVWVGRAQSAVVKGQALNKIVWKLSPWALLIGRAQTDLAFRLGESYGDGILGITLGGEFYVKEFKTHINVQDVAYVASFKPIDIEGFVNTNIKDFRIKNNTITSAEGVIAWHDAAVTFAQKVTLGDLKIDLKTKKETVEAKLADNGGALQAEGLLVIKRDGNYNFKGAFSSRDRAQSALDQSLRFMGRPGRDGKIPVSMSGTLVDFF